MCIESILGIVGSIITIAAFIGFKCDLVQHFKKRPINELYEESLDKKLTDKVAKSAHFRTIFLIRVY